MGGSPLCRRALPPSATRTSFSCRQEGETLDTQARMKSCNGYFYIKLSPKHWRMIIPGSKAAMRPQKVTYLLRICECSSHTARPGWSR